jgi:hypothetical protein
MIATDALWENRMSDWLDVLLDYYDKNYTYSMNGRDFKRKISVETDHFVEVRDIAFHILNLTTEKIDVR